MTHDFVESVALNIRNAGFSDTGFHVKGLDQIDPAAANVYRTQARAAVVAVLKGIKGRYPNSRPWQLGVEHLLTEIEGQQ